VRGYLIILGDGCHAKDEMSEEGRQEKRSRVEDTNKTIERDSFGSLPPLPLKWLLKYKKKKERKKLRYYM